MKSRFVVLLVIAFLCVIGVSYNFGARSAHHKPHNLVSEEYPLLATRIFIDNPKDPLINFTPLRQELQDYFESQDLNGGLYFEYLPTGTQVRVRDDNKEQAASLLKVPLAMEALKSVEEGKISLDKKVTLQQSWLNSAYGSLYKKGAGYELTLGETIKILLTESDNTALNAIVDTINGLVLPQDGVFSFVDIPITQNEDLSVSLSTRSYSSILKCLYLACYLDKDHSQQILQHLTETPFDNRLVAGIPDKNIKIAHKIGVFELTAQSDCGIVYVPNRPYILCMSIEGADSSAVNNHFAEISKRTYDFVTKAD